jgi:hypothetical protein
MGLLCNCFPGGKLNLLNLLADLFLVLLQTLANSAKDVTEIIVPHHLGQPSSSAKKPTVSIKDVYCPLNQFTDLIVAKWKLRF